MPSKKKKYNARFPAGRIKKIMQTDEEVGKVAQAVPIIICLFYQRFQAIRNRPKHVHINVGVQAKQIQDLDY